MFKGTGFVVGTGFCLGTGFVMCPQLQLKYKSCGPAHILMMLIMLLLQDWLRYLSLRLCLVAWHLIYIGPFQPCSFTLFAGCVLQPSMAVCWFLNLLCGLCFPPPSLLFDFVYMCLIVLEGLQPCAEYQPSVHNLAPALSHCLAVPLQSFELDM